MNRRSLLAIAIAPAATLAPLAAMAGHPVGHITEPLPARADEPQLIDPHAAWLQQWRAARQAWSDSMADRWDNTPESEQHWKRSDDLGELIASTAPNTVAGAAAQVAWVLEEMGEDPGDDRFLAALRGEVGVLAHARRVSVSGNLPKQRPINTTNEVNH